MFSDEAVDLVTPPPSGARKGWVVTAKLTTSARQQCREITEPARVCPQTTHVECQAGTDRAYTSNKDVSVCVRVKKQRWTAIDQSLDTTLRPSQTDTRRGSLWVTQYWIFSTAERKTTQNRASPIQRGWSVAQTQAASTGWASLCDDKHRLEFTLYSAAVVGVIRTAYSCVSVTTTRVKHKTLYSCR